MDVAQTAPRGNVRRRNTPGANKTVSRAGGSSTTMMKLYTDDAPGLRVDPVVVVVLALAYIGSVFFLHIYGKFTRVFLLDGVLILISLRREGSSPLDLKASA
ncbi:22793_t:CDS:2 [Entrophospora sp. SA101]|nr:22793_t:CDS:2 [Entrophospora sp. SA101]